MYVTLTDATNPGNFTDMLSPTEATANTGVGIRIFNGSNAVKFGPDSSEVGNTNQWQVTTVRPGSSTVSIPLTAMYVQVGSTVRGGPVSAIATFTLAYN
jgi:type 1 fimbria pilin